MIARKLSVLIAFAALALAAEPASAKKAVVRGGVKASALAPAGLSIGPVEAPLAVGLPSRVTFVDDQGRAEIVADVLIAASAVDARAALQVWVGKLSRADVPPAAVGDGGFGQGTSLGFTKDNVMVALRRVRGARDLAAVAGTMVTKIAAAPAGKTTAPAVTIAASNLEQGVPVAVPLPSGILAMRLRTTGPAAVRMTKDGWTITRTGGGEIGVTAVGVDELLRVTR